MYWQLFREERKTYYFPPVGDWQNADWKNILKELPDGTRFEYVPESLMKLWNDMLPERIAVTTDDSTWDYIYKIEKLSKYKDEKRLDRKIRGEYRVEIEAITGDNIQEVRSFSRMAEAKIRETHEDSFKVMDEDDGAMEYILDHWYDFHTLEGIIVKTDGKIASFVIWEKMDDITYVALFHKSMYEYRGAEAVCLQEMLRILSDRGGKYINYACDAGILGLRKAKTIRNPEYMLKKYAVVLKGNS